MAQERVPKSPAGYVEDQLLMEKMKLSSAKANASSGYTEGALVYLRVATSSYPLVMSPSSASVAPIFNLGKS